MNRTKIEWVFNPDGSRPGWSWSPITGCLNGCSYCYARKLANGRLRKRYLANRHMATPDHSTQPFYPRFWPERLDDPLGKAVSKGRTTTIYGHKPRGIFVCDMSDLFGIGIPEEWTRQVLDVISDCPHDRFYLLTKQFQNLAKFSPFPDNCCVGVTATDYISAHKAMYFLGQIEAKIKYVSAEPLLGPFTDPEPIESLKLITTWEVVDDLDWIIIGAQTKPLVLPQREWVDEIVAAADKAGVKVFLKNSLKPLFLKEIRQELPQWRQEMPV